MSKKELRAWRVSSQLFDEILEMYEEWVVKVDDITPYVKGSKFKASLFYDGIKQLVCQERILTGKGPDWYQCICIRDDKLEGRDYKHHLTGGVAYRTLKNRILRYYSEEQYNTRLYSFEAEYNQDLNQMHYNWLRQPDTIYKYSNCVKYDINGAYASALIEIFPRAKEEILRLYNERKDKPVNKDIINYFVGMLCRVGHRKTYNYIVQQIRRRMDAVVGNVGGALIYANTDGFAVVYPDNYLSTSRELGDFKLEYQGDIWTYRGANYWIMQTGDKITGNVLYQVRPLIDLRSGKVVEYRRVKKQYTVAAGNIKEIRKEYYEEGR